MSRSIAVVGGPRDRAWLAPMAAREPASPAWLSGLNPQVTILMCTYNGARFLRVQLASLEQQSYGNWRLVVSDDGSSDETLDILRNFATRVRQPVELRRGPRRGAAANFMALAADPSIEGELFAFCDQDDVWHADKLSRALARVKTNPVGVPFVYGARTRLVDTDGEGIGWSPLFRRAPSFANALVQSIAGGNTMMFNRAAKRLMERAGAVEVVSHDWWAYQLVTGNGGSFHYDPEPRLDYCQHGSNCVGANRGMRARWYRLRMLVDGRFARWNDTNLAALQKCRHLLTDDAKSLLDAYVAMRSRWFGARLKEFVTSKIRRQTAIGNVGLFIGIALRKI